MSPVYFFSRHLNSFVIISSRVANLNLNLNLNLHPRSADDAAVDNLNLNLNLGCQPRLTTHAPRQLKLVL